MTIRTSSDVELDDVITLTPKPFSACNVECMVKECDEPVIRYNFKDSVGVCAKHMGLVRMFDEKDNYLFRPVQD